MQEVTDVNPEEKAETVKIKVCWCGNNSFHILESREIVCSDCRHFIDGEMVFSISSKVRN